MPAQRQISPAFLNGPFTAAAFVDAGFSKKLLLAKRFTRWHPRVWVSSSYEMTHADRREAARLALPPHARMTGITRIQDLGLDHGDRTPLHFVVEGDLHLDLEGITLHRTAQMPPTDDRGVTPAPAFVAYCVDARVIDAIAVGDWLLYWKHMSLDELADLVTEQPWRNGAAQARSVLPSLITNSRSLPESKLRIIFDASGIAGLEPNAPYEMPSGRVVEVDLLHRGCRFAIEYDGSHHQTERGQYLKDIDRYEAFRDAELRYKLVTKEHMHYPKGVVLNIYHRLLDRGYDGPAPEFGTRWQSIFQKIRPAPSGG